MNKENLVVAGVVLALAFSGLAFFGGGIGPKGDRGDRGVKGDLGGASGPEYYGLQIFNAGHVDGGLYFATTTLGNSPMDVINIVQRSGYVRYLDVNSDETTTFTFPASSTLTHFIPSVGSCSSLMIENSGDTVLTIAGGTGTLIFEPDGQNVAIAAGGFAEVELCRKNDTDFVITVNEVIPG